MTTSALWEGLSLDPRTWPVPAAAPPAPAAGRTPVLLAGAGSLLLLATGAGLAWWSRSPAPSVATGTVAVPSAPRISDRTLPLAGADDLAGALAANGVAPGEAQAVAAAARGAIAPSGELRAALQLAQQGDGPTHLVRLEVSNPDGSGAIVSAAGAGFEVRRVAADLQSRLVSRKGVMDGDSFYSSAVAAGVTDSLIPDIAKALAFDFDFQRDIHRGDRFEAAFEQDRDAAEDPIGPPRLLFASITTAAHAASVYRFAPPGGTPGWYDAGGRTVVRALMRTPVDGARVSSTFGIRLHPVLGFVKMHKGIDFAVPTGTPVYAAGDARVEHAAMTGSAGNMVKLRHDNGWETVYMHLNRIMPGVTEGGRVTQGEEIGEVGTTGRSTGPHLHYEVHIGGEPVDPATIATNASAAPPLAGKVLAAFRQARDRIDLDRARGSD